MANAMPINAPMLRTTGFQSAPRSLPGEERGFSSSSALVLDSFGCFLGTVVSVSLPKASSQSISTHGSKLPSRIPATPQDVKYRHE